MAQRKRIQCINKTDRTNHYERIRNVGGVNADGKPWKISEDQAIAYIKNNTYSYYVHVGNETVDVIIAKSSLGREYLKTKPDGLTPDNLLSLPECP